MPKIIVEFTRKYEVDSDDFRPCGCCHDEITTEENAADYVKKCYKQETGSPTGPQTWDSFYGYFLTNGYKELDQECRLTVMEYDE